MVCPACGGPVQGAFCARCGTPLRTPPPYPAPPPFAYVPRVPRHLQALGVLWCVYGAYRAARGTFAALFLMGIATHGIFRAWGSPRVFPFLPWDPWMAGAATFLAAISLVGAVASFAVGFSLLQRKTWGRLLAIAMGILVLIRIPLGTALGIYTLWVLAPAASALEYDALTNR